MFTQRVVSVVDTPLTKIEVLFDGAMYLIRQWRLFEDGTSKVSDIQLLKEDADILARELAKHLKNPPPAPKGPPEEVSEELRHRLSWREWNK